MKNYEFHIIIFWHNACKKYDELISLISPKLTIIKVYEYHWDESKALENYAVFYGNKSDKIKYKLKECGKGFFRVLIVKDNNPIYQERKTSSGYKNVNINIFDLKQKLRNITGGGHKVHASDNQSEFIHNLAVLFGISKNEVDDIVPDCGEIHIVNRNIYGVSGWHSWKELLKILGLCTDYVVLRNFETLKKGNIKSCHEDVDILVKDRKIAETTIAGKRKFRNPNRVMIEVMINGQPNKIDVRYYGDNYYCKEWENNILESRVKYSFFTIPDLVNYNYSLLYHALVQKEAIANDYLEKFIIAFDTKEIEYLRKKLDLFMTKNNYTYVTPLDSSVYTNLSYRKQLNLSTRRVLFVWGYSQLRKFKLWFLTTKK